jgi:hypothetical protein
VPGAGKAVKTPKWVAVGDFHVQYEDHPFGLCPFFSLFVLAPEFEDEDDDEDEQKIERGPTEIVYSAERR